MKYSGEKTASGNTFFSCFDISEAADGKRSFSGDIFAGLGYARELELKNSAVRLFFEKNGVGVVPDKITHSVLPRHYRSTSKRSCAVRNGRLYFLRQGLSTDRAGAVFEPSVLEPETHEKIYAFTLEIFSSIPFQYAARHLNYCIIRGNTERPSLILNFDRADGTIVRKLKDFSEILKKQHPEIQSFFMYVDETRSDYYLESIHSGGRPPLMKKFFGPEFLDIPVPGLGKLLYPPVSFAQINSAMIPEFLSTVRRLVLPSAGETLLDLYCGCGMIGLSLAGDFKHIRGVELDGPAVTAAEMSAKHYFKNSDIKFIKGEISPELLKQRLAAPSSPETLILDPPYSGTARGVIRALASRGAEKILHVFCGTDNIPRETAEWSDHGYQPVRAIPVDMFSGTASLETFILFGKKIRQS